MSANNTAQTVKVSSAKGADVRDKCAVPAVIGPRKPKCRAGACDSEFLRDCVMEYIAGDFDSHELWSILGRVTAETKNVTALLKAFELIGELGIEVPGAFFKKARFAKNSVLANRVAIALMNGHILFQHDDANCDPAMCRGVANALIAGNMGSVILRNYRGTPIPCVFKLYCEGSAEDKSTRLAKLFAVEPWKSGNKE